MFDDLSGRFGSAFKSLSGQSKITDVNIAESVREIRRALLDADVNYKTAKDFTNKVKEKALGMNVLNAVSPGQLLIKITHDELRDLMGGQKKDIQVQGNPGIVLMSGLQGSGKTTFSGKLANYLKTKKGKKPLLVACDVYRPAAIDQLKIWGERTGSPVVSSKLGADAAGGFAGAFFAKELVALKQQRQNGEKRRRNMQCGRVSIRH